MQNRDTTTLVTDAQRPFALGRNESFSSGVSWGAILGGAFVAAAMGLIMPIVFAEAPSPCQGDAEAKPSPVPSDTSTRHFSSLADDRGRR